MKTANVKRAYVLLVNVVNAMFCVKPVLNVIVVDVDWG